MVEKSLKDVGMETFKSVIRLQSDMLKAALQLQLRASHKTLPGLCGIQECLSADLSLEHGHFLDL